VQRARAAVLRPLVQVLPPPPVGLYAIYPGQQPVLGPQQLQELRADPGAVPLPPSMTVDCPCSRVHTWESVMVGAATWGGPCSFLSFT
jgi:hypothetical protein